MVNDFLSNKYGNRNQEIKEFFRKNGINHRGRSPRDISFGNVAVTDQHNTFAIYARGEEEEKDVFLRIFEKYHPIPGSVRRLPEPSNPRKCCARWEHSTKDAEIMLNVVKEILSASGN